MPHTTELVVASRLPLEWRLLEQLPEPGALAHAAHAAVQVLQGELTADERRRVEPRSEDDAIVLQELHRVEAKVDLLLDLFAQWHQKEQGLPPAVDCRWTAQDLQWDLATLPPELRLAAVSVPHSASSPESYSASQPASHPAPLPALVQLYPGPRSLRPLELPGLLTVSAGSQGWHCRLVFAELGEGFADLLGRYLFRLHRREVAEISRRVTALTVPATFASAPTPRGVAGVDGVAPTRQKCPSGVVSL